MPDMTLLPDLAMVFGVPIDDLFTYSKDRMYDKIGSILKHGNQLDNRYFQDFEKFLLGELAQDSSSHKVVSTLAWLYFKYAEQLREKAVIYAKQALDLKPNSKPDINIISNASNGTISDWNVRNRHELIAYYQRTLKLSPDNKRLYFYLLDNLIDDGRLEEAKKTLAESRSANPSPLNDYYHILIQERLHGFAAVKEDYLKLVDLYRDNWSVLFSVANSFSQNGAYQEAIPIWEQAFEAQEKPRYVDYYEAIAQCYLLLGDKPQAIGAYQKVLTVLADDWGLSFGTAVDRIKHKIHDLSKTI